MSEISDSPPPQKMLVWPTLRAIIKAGGTAENSAIRNAVAETLQLNERQCSVLHNTNRGTRTLLEYRLAWARTVLRELGAVEKVAPRTWAVTEAGRDMTEEDIRQTKGKQAEDKPPTNSL